MCGKDQYCNEIDTEYCAKCHTDYMKEKDILYNPKKLFVVGIPKYDWSKKV
jgi:hypothetical protein